MARRELIWSPASLDDVRQIAEFVAAESPARAKNVVREIFESGESLGDFPFRGREVPELPKSGTRELIVGPYRLLYSAFGEQVEIVRIIHGSRDFHRAFGGFLD